MHKDTKSLFKSFLPAGAGVGAPNNPPPTGAGVGAPNNPPPVGAAAGAPNNPPAAGAAGVGAPKSDCPAINIIDEHNI